MEKTLEISELFEFKQAPYVHVANSGSGKTILSRELEKEFKNKVDITYYVDSKDYTHTDHIGESIKQLVKDLSNILVDIQKCNQESEKKQLLIIDDWTSLVDLVQSNRSKYEYYKFENGHLTLESDLRSKEFLQYFIRDLVTCGRHYNLICLVNVTDMNVFDPIIRNNLSKIILSNDMSMDSLKRYGFTNIKNLDLWKSKLVKLNTESGNQLKYKLVFDIITDQENAFSILEVDMTN